MSVEETIAASSGTFAIVALPAYIGWADRGFVAFVIYALVAGVALAIADRLTATHSKGKSLPAPAQHISVRCLTVAFVGGPVYGLLIAAV